jgi:hypothetical protein
MSLMSNAVTVAAMSEPHTEICRLQFSHILSAIFRHQNLHIILRMFQGSKMVRRITLQHLEPPTTGLIQPKDAVFKNTRQPGDGNAPPPAVILDFMYRAAAYKKCITLYMTSL